MDAKERVVSVLERYGIIDQLDTYFKGEAGEDNMRALVYFLQSGRDYKELFKNELFKRWIKSLNDLIIQIVNTEYGLHENNRN